MTGIDWQMIDLASSTLLLLLVPAWFLFSKSREMPKFFFGYGFAVILSEALKVFFLVPRPAPFEGYGFPSSHALLAYFVATFIFLEKPRLWLPLFALAGIVAAGRVFIGVHTLADISVGALLGLVLAAAWHETKMLKADLTELARQSVHFLGVLLIPLAFFLGQQAIGIASLALAALVFLAAYASGTVKAFSRFFARKGETRYFNAAYYLGSCGLALLAFPQAAAFAGIAALAVGDSLSTLYGKHFGQMRIPWNPDKTVEGSLACLVATYLALYFILGREGAVVAAIAATVIESLPVNDNITLPLGIGALVAFA
jgi:dolichol kinase